MAKRKDQNDLGRRERQILEVVYKLGEASVSEVLADLDDPPTYDTVRTVIRVLETKSFLRHRKVGTKYVYSPTVSPKSASKQALSRIMKTFFAGSASDAVATIFDLAAPDLSEEDLTELQELIEKARKEGR